jgi:hypothetical protein
MKYVGHLGQQVSRAPTNEHHIASLGRELGRCGHTVQILLVGRMEPKPVDHAYCRFVQPVQLGILHMLNLRGLMEQFAVEHLPAKSLGKPIGDLAAPGTVLASDGNDFHRRLLAK